MSPLHELLVDAFQDFEAWLLATAWRGKENDCVNLFAHKFLFCRIDPNGPIYDPTQVGIEIGVPQPPGIGIKKGVRKDLVIWSAPNSTTFDEKWNPTRFPIAIIEWKARKKRTNLPLIFPYDLTWIKAYSQLDADYHGYCATVDFTSTDRRIHTVALRSGEVTEDFHRNQK